MMELPLVIVDVQRLGPATGATTIGQGDVQFSHWVTAGGYPMIVLAPSTAVECATLTMEAFVLAQRFRTPVVVLTDKELNLTQVTVDWPELPAPEPVTVVPETVPAALLGENKIVRFTGSSHDERQLITKDPVAVERLNRRLIAKIEAHREDFERGRLIWSRKRERCWSPSAPRAAQWKSPWQKPDDRASVSLLWWYRACGLSLRDCSPTQRVVLSGSSWANSTPDCMRARCAASTRSRGGELAAYRRAADHTRDVPGAVPVTATVGLTVLLALSGLSGQCRRTRGRGCPGKAPPCGAPMPLLHHPLSALSMERYRGSCLGAVALCDMPATFSSSASAWGVIPRCCLGDPCYSIWPEPSRDPGDGCACAAGDGPGDRSRGEACAECDYAAVSGRDGDPGHALRPWSAFPGAKSAGGIHWLGQLWALRSFASWSGSESRSLVRVPWVRETSR